MEKLKEMLVKKERMRSMLKEVDATLRFPWDFVITRDTVTVFRVDPDTLKREIASRPVDAILDSVGLYTILFWATRQGQDALWESVGQPVFAQWRQDQVH